MISEIEKNGWYYVIVRFDPLKSCTSISLIKMIIARYLVIERRGNSVSPREQWGFDLPW